jgi:FixJ family two-component response regulator
MCVLRVGCLTIHQHAFDVPSVPQSGTHLNDKDPPRNFKRSPPAPRGQSAFSGALMNQIDCPTLRESESGQGDVLTKVFPYRDCVVYVLDGDDFSTKMLERTLSLTTARVITFSTIAEFNSREVDDAPSCLVLETSLPDGCGLQLQRDLARGGVELPFIFLTTANDARLATLAIRAGAVEFLVKPTLAREILGAIHVALAVDARRVGTRTANGKSVPVCPTLTAREFEVVSLVASGMLNKEVGFRLGISEPTVKVHRRRIMKKMGAKTVVDLIRRFDILKQQMLVHDRRIATGTR